MEMIENKMVVDSEWENVDDTKKRLHSSGYYNPRTGVFVPKENILDYMIEVIKSDHDQAHDVMDYFYGSWIEEE